MRLNSFALSLFIIPIYILFPNYNFSQNFTATVNQKVVEVGQFFQLTYSINSNASNFNPPDFKDFDIYSGPNQSTSMSFINGVMSSSMSLSYYLIPKKTGIFTLGPAKISANGKQLQSNAVSIEVVKGSAVASSSNQNLNSNGNNNTFTANESVSSGDVFIRTSVSKTTCFVGEQINVKQKIYSLHQMKGFQNYKSPSYTGFWSKEEGKTAQLTQRTETIDGKNYYVVEFNNTILFPQKSGKLAIDPITIDVLCAVQNKNPRSLMEQFFGGGFMDRQFSAKSKKTEINVEEIPTTNKPQNFSGAVGSYTFKAEISKNKVKENEAIHLKIIITGKGNINLIDAPGIIFPPEFETYDPKVTENVSVSGIVSGTKTYDYLIIPRKAGNYTINDFGFSFFDAEKKQFITIASPEFNVIIEPGEKNSSAELSAFDSSNPIEERQNDIRYIKNGDLELTPMNNEFFGSMLHFSILGALLLSFVLTAGIFQYNKKLGKDIVLLKERRALKLAKKQLSIANKYKIQNEKVKFYSEILIGLNQFISDKFNIPLSDLSRDRIKNEMAVRKMPDSISNDYVALMESCEFVKYAPGSLPDQLDSSYDRAISLITSIEKQLKS